MIAALYVPGSRPDRFDKAEATGATVILDLEDAVAADDKAQAREHVAAWLTDGGVSRTVQVRVNAPGSVELAADLAALPPDVELRVPKVEGPEDLAAFGRRPVHALIETALGVERLLDIARAEGVRSVALGEADLAAELGLEGEDAFGWIRSRIVVAARAAGLPAPMMSAYPAIADVDGLAESCARGRRLGMRGRTAIHPSQVPIIRSVFAPRDEEIAWAHLVLDTIGDTGVGVLPDGSMVDTAMARRARAVLGMLA